VKEVGIYLVGCPRIAENVEVYYNNLWELAHLDVSAYTKTVWDQQWQVSLLALEYSPATATNPEKGVSYTSPKLVLLVRKQSMKLRCSCILGNVVDGTAFCNDRSPLPQYVEVPHTAGYPVLSDPDMFQMAIETPGSNNSSLHPHFGYLSFAPPELSFGKYLTDEQAWVDTIKSVGIGASVRISTMDWLGQSQYTNQTVYWSTLSSAVSEVIFSKHAEVKILVAYWAHYINNTDQYLKSLLYSNTLCSSSKYNKCSGKVEIKYYMVPGFNLTGPANLNGTSTGNIYPGFTRVNHGKYTVSDVRAHIGTSNLIWDYFYTTAGVSFGTYNPAIILQLQEIFDADWNSPYAVPVESLEEARAYSS
ncbi:unnamed protein product, partial [Ilex paraguariensis]